MRLHFEWNNKKTIQRQPRVRTRPTVCRSPLSETRWTLSSSKYKVHVWWGAAVSRFLFLAQHQSSNCSDAQTSGALLCMNQKQNWAAVKVKVHAVSGSADHVPPTGTRAKRDLNSAEAIYRFWLRVLDYGPQISGAGFDCSPREIRIRMKEAEKWTSQCG